MKRFVSYIRVSSDRQGKSGLGMEAQRDAVAQYIGAEGTLLAQYTEVESAKSHKNRPQLLAALSHCKKQRAILVIAKLDRLARNVAFISALMESDAEFVCCDNPHATPLMLHMLAAFAEHERNEISQRTKDALQQVKRELAEKGFRKASKSGRIFTRLGNPNCSEALEKARAALAYKPPSPEVLNLILEWRSQGDVLRKIASRLNGLNIRTPQGCRWYASTIRAAILRNSGPRMTDSQIAANALYEDIELSRPFV